MRFCVIKIKNIAVVVLLMAIIGGLIALCVIPATADETSDAPLGLTVVIDAGHGGSDGGMVGKTTGVKESDLNLAISKYLQGFLKDFGFSVIMTRTTSEGLGGIGGTKLKDMKEREKIINSQKADLVLSIHCNSFPLANQKGAQVFYAKGEQSSKIAAEKMQRSLAILLKTSRTALTGDYFILECSPYTSMIVECGFLSNAEEESLLMTSEYQEKVAYAVFSGVLSVLIAD